MRETFNIGQEFERRKAYLPGGAAVAALRKQGLEDFLLKGLPTAKTEGWRYADLKRLDADSLPPAAARKTSAVAAVTDWPLAVASAAGVELSQNIAGVSFTSAIETLKAKGPEGQTLFLPAAHDHPFDQLNRAFADQGFVLEIPPGKAVGGIEVVMSSAGLTGGARYVRNLIRLGAGASANIFLRTASADREGWLNVVSKIQLGAEAKLTLYMDFDSGPGVLLSSLLGVGIAERGRLSLCTLAGGLASLRHEVHASLEGEGSELLLTGGLMAAANEVAGTSELRVVARAARKIPDLAGLVCMRDA